MKAFTGSLTKGLPPLLGVLCGILLYRPGIVWVVIISVTLLASLAFLSLGQKAMHKRPQLGRFWIELWVFSAIAIVALCTLIILWLTVNAPSFIPGEDAEVKAISGALVGAVTAFLAILWTKEIEDAAGPFWPSTQFKKALAKVFKGDAEITSHGDSTIYAAIFLDQVPEGPSGWDFNARYERAKIIKAYLEKQKLKKSMP